MTMNENISGVRIGLDWADKKHDFCLLENDGSIYEYGTFEHNPAAIDKWAMNLCSRFNGQPVAICLELKSGPIVSCLRKYDFITLFFVNPNGLANYRGSFRPSGAKSDPTDAFYQLDYLMKHASALREVTVDDEETRIIQQLVEDRKFFVDERVKQTNRLTAALKAYYPLALEIFNDLDSKVFCDFVNRWPNLAKLKAARESTLVEFLKSHKANRGDLVNKRITLIKNATSLTDDPGIIIPHQMKTLNLIKQLTLSLETIKDYDKQIASRFSQHEDVEFFGSLPGAGPVYAPRLLAAFGSDRDRFIDADEVNKCSGIAPVKESSGQKTWTHWRYQCSKFVRQTFVEWANQSLHASFWAKEFYDKKRAHGMSHQATLRALAFKWIRILFRCWKDHKKYDEAAYLFSLKERHCEIKKN